MRPYSITFTNQMNQTVLNYTLFTLRICRIIFHMKLRSFAFNIFGDKIEKERKMCYVRPECFFLLLFSHFLSVFLEFHSFHRITHVSSTYRIQQDHIINAQMGSHMQRSVSIVYLFRYNTNPLIKKRIRAFS